MTGKKNEAGNLLPMIVTEGVTVNVLPNEKFEYLMPTKEVAIGYGTSRYAIQKAFLRNNSELTEGKHYIIGVDNLSTQLNIPHNAVLWTKRGIVRLGFFIKSERAKLFRDWAEELVLNRIEQPRQTLMFDMPKKQLPARRNHNRLTAERLLNIMVDVARIEDHEVRMSITDKLMKGGIA